MFIKELPGTANKKYEIVEAEIGEEVIAELEESKPDVVILDTHLSGIDGFEVCKKIKEEQENPPKIIILTDMIDAVDIGKTREVGADDYCAKAGEGIPLIRAIENLI